MPTINSVKELKAAIKAGRSPLVPGNRKMKIIMAGVASVFALTGGGAIPGAGAIAGSILGQGIMGAVSEPVLIVAIIASMATIISVVAICKGGGVVIKWDVKKGVFTLETKKSVR